MATLLVALPEVVRNVVQALDDVWRQQREIVQSLTEDAMKMSAMRVDILCLLPSESLASKVAFGSHSLAHCLFEPWVR